MGIMGASVLALIFLGAFAQTFYREVLRTPWDLVEALVLFVAIGHVIAIPIAITWRSVEQQSVDIEWLYINIVASVVSALLMAGGAVWVFRRLNRLGEKRRVKRLLYLLLGLLMFPSMTAMPFITLGLFLTGFNRLGIFLILFNFAIWLLLLSLNNRTAKLPDPSDMSLDAEINRELAASRGERTGNESAHSSNSNAAL